MARPQVEVIGVGKHELAACLVQVARLQRLDVGLCAHGRKGGHVNRAVRRLKRGKPCGAL